MVVGGAVTVDVTVVVEVCVEFTIVVVCEVTVVFV